MDEIIQGDCLEVLKTLESESVDAVVTDPPYGLSFMGKKWDYDVPSVEIWKECLRVLKPGGYLLSFAGTRTQHRMAVNIEDAGFEIRDMIAWVYSTGFPKSLNVFKYLKKQCTCGNMEEYERTKKIPEYFLRFMQEADLQKEIADRKTKGKVLQSGLSKQSLPTKGLQLPNKIREEQSCMEGRNNIQTTKGELQGSNLHEMPEGISTNGEERRLHNEAQTGDGSTPEPITDENGSDTSQRPQSEQQQYREPCAFCKQWGTQATRTHGVGSALKPALEPITMARKPIEGTVAENVLKYGTGGINIDESRVGTDGGGTHCDNRDAEGNCLGHNNAGRSTSGETIHAKQTGEVMGRFPANLLHDNSEEVRECFPETKSTPRTATIGGTGGVGVNTNFQRGSETSNFNDSGNASRFFKSIPQGRFPANLIHDNSEEVRECFPETGNRVDNRTSCKSGDTAIWGDDNKVESTRPQDNGGNASRFFKSIIYTAKASKSERNKGCEGMPEQELRGGGGRVEAGYDRNDPEQERLRKAGTAYGAVKAVQSNNHPTIKPIALMEYLIKMVTPKGGLVLDPFAGSGSTLIAAKRNGFKYIGIERESEYVQIAQARLDAEENTLF